MYLKVPEFDIRLDMMLICISGDGSLIICHLTFFPDLAGFVLGENDYIISQVSLILFWFVVSSEDRKSVV